MRSEALIFHRIPQGASRTFITCYYLLTYNPSQHHMQYQAFFLAIAVDHHNSACVLRIAIWPWPYDIWPYDYDHMAMTHDS